MTIKEFMKKTGVTKRKYVQEWLEEGLIPGVTMNEKTGEYELPSSARRPYRPRLKSNANASVIRASILNACLKREYISCNTYDMSNREFLSFIDDLMKAELITKRIEDGITYYDSTSKSDKYHGKSIHYISKFIISCLGTVTEHAAYGVTKAIIERIEAA